MLVLFGPGRKPRFKTAAGRSAHKPTPGPPSPTLHAERSLVGLIPACGDIDSCAHAPCQSKTPISQRSSRHENMRGRRSPNQPTSDVDRHGYGGPSQPNPGLQLGACNVTRSAEWVHRRGFDFCLGAEVALMLTR